MTLEQEAEELCLKQNRHNQAIEPMLCAFARFKVEQREKQIGRRLAQITNGTSCEINSLIVELAGVLPCPFCGSLAAWDEGEQKAVYGNEQVYCPSCYATAAPYSTPQEALKAWNTRLADSAHESNENNHSLDAAHIRWALKSLKNSHVQNNKHRLGLLGSEDIDTAIDELESIDTDSLATLARDDKAVEDKSTRYPVGHPLEGLAIMFCEVCHRETVFIGKGLYECHTPNCTNSQVQTLTDCVRCGTGAGNLNKDNICGECRDEAISGADR